MAPETRVDTACGYHWAMDDGMTATYAQQTDYGGTDPDAAGIDRIGACRGRRIKALVAAVPGNP